MVRVYDESMLNKENELVQIFSLLDFEINSFGYEMPHATTFLLINYEFEN